MRTAIIRFKTIELNAAEGQIKSCESNG